MKKLFSIFLSGLAIASTTLSFQSCADEYDPAIVTKHDLTVNQYTENFIARYGIPATNHTWGFTTLKPSIASTRAVTRDGATIGVGAINVNRNQWAEKDNNGYKEQAIAKDVQIPGWPNFDGKYYASINDETLDRMLDTEDGNTYRPVGDVTEYEIQYVSAWFRTHPIEDPTQYRENLHLSDFFIQNVCADHDQIAYESMDVATGANGANINKATDAINAGLTNVTLKGGTQEQQLDYPLDYLCFKPIGANPTVDETWTHVNNFNAMSNNWNPEENANNPKRQILYVTSSGTEDFACRASFGTNNDSGALLYDWVLVKLQWIENGVSREGYYLAFDYAAEKEECKVEGDNYYSNWIVKITPAHFSEESSSKRVMCEDLGNTYDFDFNDVVFDVRYEKTRGTWDGEPDNLYDAIISIQAAGGTLPIYVGVNPASRISLTNIEAYEAHNLLGGSTQDPINVGGTSRNIAIYRVEDLTTSNPDDIPIFVVYADGRVASVAKANRGNISDYNPGPYTPPQTVTDETAPQKFAVPITTAWMKECEFIEDGYPDFPNWVSNPTQHSTWYNVIGDNSKIYKYVHSENHHAPGETTEEENGNNGENGDSNNNGNNNDGDTTPNKITVSGNTITVNNLASTGVKIEKENFSSLKETSTITVVLNYGSSKAGGAVYAEGVKQKQWNESDINNNSITIEITPSDVNNSSDNAMSLIKDNGLTVSFYGTPATSVTITLNN
ncbi:MAG: hypothetical protein MJZ69_00685 [Bacteroidaceae bacterium]|nr:hypothetical protein [Bacteroidaceae bacterium]